MNPDSFILCDRLVKKYKIEGAEVTALQGLDLAVRQGEMLGIVGSSGSGKTSLMNVLGGLDRPTSGRVWVNGLNLFETSDRALTRYRKRTVGFVWQQGARNLIPVLSAVENVELPMALTGAPAADAHRRAQELLELVGLAGRARHTLGQLSGGEQQRVAIAVALANRPALLLADEPTGELDSATALAIFQLLQQLNQAFGLTIVLVSHDPGVARHVHRVIAIHDGQIASETIRRAHPEGTPGDPQFDECVVVDWSGRLRVPKEYLERYGIKGRAQLEPTPDGILIRPAPPGLGEREDGQALAGGADGAGRPKRQTGWRGWLAALRPAFHKGSRHGDDHQS
jgi:ABC-type lipoprotein export system ATPase subunit